MARPWAVLALAGLVGCGGGDEGATDAAVADAAADADERPAMLVLSPGSHDYLTVASGDSVVVAFTLRNAGGLDSTAPTAMMTGLHASEFVIENNACSGPLAGGHECTLNVRFTAGPLGVRGATLAVSALTGGGGTADLTANVVAQAAITSTTAAPLPLGGVGIGSVGVSRVAYFKNTGAVPSGTLAAHAAGVDAADVEIVTDLCSGVVLAPGASCSLYARLKPLTLGSKTAAVEVTGTPGGVGSIAISGVGLTPAMLTFDHTAFSFGNTYVGDTSFYQFGTLTNSGQAAASTAVSLTGVGAADYVVTLSSFCVGAMAGMSGCQVQVVFAPKQRGSRPAVLTIGDAQSSVTVDLSGVGKIEPTLKGAPSTLTFPTTTVGVTSAPINWIVTNVGDDPATVIRGGTSGDAADFLLTDGCPVSPAQLAAGAMCTMTWRFRPTAVGPRTFIYGLRAPTQSPEEYATLIGAGQ